MKCSNEQCQRDVWSRGLCAMHYQRFRKHGDTNTHYHQGIRQPNLIKCLSNRAEILIKPGIVAIIDKEDVDRIRKIRWCARPTRWGACYVASAQSVLLHRFLMGPNNPQIIDHINRNPLDNRKSNLRFCTHSENSKNRTKKPTFIYWYAPTSRWVVRIKKKHIGYFVNRDDAVLAVKAACKELT